MTPRAISRVTRTRFAAIGRTAGNARLPDRPGISVKLSALHPRYEAISRERVLRELTPRVLELAQKAKVLDLNFTVDAEEADRLELSLEVIGAVLADPSLAGWDGFGLAIQAYQKRAGAVIDWARDAAIALNRRLMVRLVKGAYWDTEVKRTQERGLPDYPVFTRKAMTDLNYTDCVARLLAARPHLYPQFATHNALTVAGVIEQAGGVEGYEFQRLHGMGEALYEALIADTGVACRVYAPVGGHRDLLAYLVRRLLENGANSSFVSVAADPSVPIGEILKRPQDWIADGAHARHPRIPLPRDLYGARKNSMGVEFGDRVSLDALLAGVRNAAPLAGGEGRDRRGRAERRRRGISPLERDAGCGSRRRTRARRRSLRAEPRCAHRADAGRRRKNIGRCTRRGARGRRLLPLLRRTGARFARARADAGADRRDQRTASPRTWCVRLHQPVEFPARDLLRAGRRRAGGWQCGGRQARRADAACCEPRPCG